MNLPNPEQNTYIPLLAREPSFPKLLECEQQITGAQFGVDQVPSGYGTVRVAVGYRRVLDNDPQNQPGQDYAAVRYDQEYIAGVVADGVGQSFYGDVAAKWVGQWLIENLWNRRTRPYEEQELGKLLLEQQAICAGQLESRSFSHLSPQVQKALETKRGDGSQAVFACFLWNLTTRQLVVYQVGDAIAVVHREGDGPEQIEGAVAKGRWSTAGKSQLFLKRFSDLGNNITGVVIKSDGAEPSWGTDLERETSAPGEFVRMANRMATRDDVSFVTASLAKSLPAGKDRAPESTREPIYKPMEERRGPGNTWIAEDAPANSPATVAPGAALTSQKPWPSATPGRDPVGSAPQRPGSRPDARTGQRTKQAPARPQIPMQETRQQPQPEEAPTRPRRSWLPVVLAFAVGLLVGFCTSVFFGSDSLNQTLADFWSKPKKTSSTPTATASTPSNPSSVTLEEDSKNDSNVSASGGPGGTLTLFPVESNCCRIQIDGRKDYLSPNQRGEYKILLSTPRPERIMVMLTPIEGGTPSQQWILLPGNEHNLRLPISLYSRE